MRYTLAAFAIGAGHLLIGQLPETGAAASRLSASEPSPAISWNLQTSSLSGLPSPGNLETPNGTHWPTVDHDVAVPLLKTPVMPWAGHGPRFGWSPRPAPRTGSRSPSRPGTRSSARRQRPLPVAPDIPSP